MKNTITLIITLLFIFISCKTENQEKEAFQGTLISGQATSEYIHKPIYLKYILNDSVITKIDTVSSNKTFEFFISETEYPLRAFLTNDLTNYAPKVNELNQLSSLIYFQFGSPSVPLQFRNPKDIKIFLLEKGEIKLNIQDSIYNSEISNSTLNDELNELNKELQVVMTKHNKLHKNNLMEIMDDKLLDSLMEVSTQISFEKSKILDRFILTHNNSYSSVFAFNIKPFIQEEDLEIFSQINPEIRNSDLAESGRNKLKSFVNTIHISDTLENFTLPNQNGQLVSLYDIKSKYILVDFWASWCAPCRKENAGISEYYSDFNKNDFQIVGVSVDKNKDKWLSALKFDNIQWISLIDNELVINDKFGVTSYPTNFLIDSKHKVIDKNLNSKNLKKRLIQLLE